MSYPSSIKPRVKLDALTGIKSSLANLRSIISLAYLMYVSNGRKSSIEYSVSDGNKIKINQTLLSQINSYLDKGPVDAYVNSNPLITNQYEPLYVGLTLLLKLGNLIMNTRSTTMERKGGNRYPKQIHFANNMILLDLILMGASEQDRKDFLWNWLQDKVSDNTDLEERVKLFITTCTTYTQFKLRDKNLNEIFFQTEGIYKAALQDTDGVSFTDEHEFVGPTRIYNNILKEELEPCLSIKGGVVNINDAEFISCESIGNILSNTLDICNVKDDSVILQAIESSMLEPNVDYQIDRHKPTLHHKEIIALKTKPFLLLAGISGTGKSRLVRELAFKSCPKNLQDADGTTPGNYCMIEVKPNWHDSTELLGYYSRLGKGGYQFTKFVKFLVKAMMFPDVPFFVCLDEMNLAPVEQYFAEILSILETRKHEKTKEGKGRIKTEVIIDAKYFQELEDTKPTSKDYLEDNPSDKETDTGEPYKLRLTDKAIYLKLFGIHDDESISTEVGCRYNLTDTGLMLPDNVFIVGTVNMDDTTHQFSRKVIDRAMTIEMNGGKLADMYGGSKNLEYLEEENQKKWQDAFKQSYVNADEVLAKYADVAETLKRELPTKLEEINNVLKGTPFEVSYRVLNELTIMVGVMLDDNSNNADINTIINQAVDNILLMKILPRIEGDGDMFAIDGSEETKLDRLNNIAPSIVPIDNGDGHYTAKDKIKEMIDRLKSQEFTRFWP